VSPAGATNWYPSSFSPGTGLFYIPSGNRAREDGLTVRGPGHGAIAALDPRTGEKLWEFRVNDAWFSAGVLTTASDLAFTGVTGDFYSGPAASALRDGTFYVLNARTGQMLLQKALGGSVTSGPMTYSVGGRQFVAVAAGNSLFAFALRQ
jgi:alcohol dehydrogenase (cytochrome c)